jgi:glycosyltransferase involved in cell wall biosynthesis
MAKPGCPRRVCLVQTLHAHDDKRMFHKLAMSLVRAGYEVVSIVPDTGDVPAERAGVRFVTIPRAHGLWRRFLVLPRLVRAAARQRADILIAPEPESWAAALAARMLAGGRVVFDMHEHVQTEFSKFFPRALRPFVEWLTVCVMRLFARGSALVMLTRGSFEEPWRGLSTPRVTVINTNHLQPRCAEIPEALRARYAGRPVLIHQGIFGDVRGSWQLMEAMKMLRAERPDVLCIVLGQYVYGSLEEYRAAIRDAGLEGNFDFPGVVPFEEVPAFIAASDVGLILFQPGPLNHTLAMPHKLFDYMREGTPVIAPDFSLEVGRIVRETECGLLVDVTDPRAIAQAALRLLQDRALAERLGANGRRAVEQTYNWEQEERVLLEAMARV